MRNFINSFLEKLVKLALKVYYRKWEVSGINHIPEGKPLIFASNHQNAFMDALLIATSIENTPYFLARANIFAKPLARKLLDFIRIMPIYRFRDGLGNVKKNDVVFDMCNALLENNESIIMFPEGNHGSRWSIRPLRRGVARLVFSAEEIHNWNLNIHVIPVGVQYEEQRNFRSRVYVQFGKPIKVGDYQESYKLDQRQGWNEFTEELESRMKELVVHISPKEEYEAIFDKVTQFRPFYRNFKRQFESDKRLISTIKQGKVFIEKGDKPLKFYPHNYLAAGFAWINNILLYKLIKSFIKNKVKDKVFNSSLKLAFGLVFVPLFYSIIALCLYLVSDNILLPLIYLLLSALSNYFGLDLLKQWFSKINSYEDFHHEEEIIQE